MTDGEQFAAALAAGLAQWGLTIPPAQADVLRAHYQAMVEANRVMNLTRIVEPVAAAWKHYLDSLAPLLWLRTMPDVAVQSVLDFGTGAGFPAVPLAAARPDWRVTAIDGTRKKIDFLSAFIAEAGLRNLHAEQAHSAHFKSPRPFDLIVFRAVGPLVEAMRDAARLLGPGGRLVAYKTPSGEAGELSAAAKEVETLGFDGIESFAYELYPSDEPIRRTLLIVRKRA